MWSWLWKWTDIYCSRNINTLTALAIAAIAGIFLNAILPGNDYEFGKNPDGDASRGVYMMNTDNDEEEES